MTSINEETLIRGILDPSTRESSLSELSKHRENIEDLALKLWNPFGILRFELLGVVAALLLEVVSVYPLLSPPALTSQSSTRVCNVLALFQCIASHEKTKKDFMQAYIPLYLYPFLNTTSKTRPFEYLRLTSLGVIGALVKNDNPDVIDFLLSTEIVPLCLRIMETGNELSRTVSIFILQKILLDDLGLSYICQTSDRLVAVISVLNNMAQQMNELKSLRLIKHIIRCYLRLLDDKSAYAYVYDTLPAIVRDGTLFKIAEEDGTISKYSSELRSKLSI